MRGLLIALGAALLAGCSSEDQAASRQEAPALAMVEPDAPREAADGAPTAGPIEVKVPQLAYSYALGFVLPGPRIAAAQERHRALCAQMGSARCQLLALERGGGTGQSTQALLRMRVASAEAARFHDALAKAVAEAGGRPFATKVTAADVSKEIVDTEARIRQRTLLVSRLTEILRTRQGKVSDLVEAERSVAQAQEELDRARGWLSELRGRVAMSDFEVRYDAVAPSESPDSAGSQLAEALQGSAMAFLMGLRMLLTLAIYLAPWLLIAAPAAWWLWRRRKRATAADQG